MAAVAGDEWGRSERWLKEGMTPRTPGSTVALCSPCLIVMDEPRVYSLALIYGDQAHRVRTRTTWEEPPEPTLPESDVASVSCCRAYAPYVRARVVDLLMIFMNTCGMKRWQDGGGEHYFLLLSVDIFLGCPFFPTVFLSRRRRLFLHQILLIRNMWERIKIRE